MATPCAFVPDYFSYSYEWTGFWFAGQSVTISWTGVHVDSPCGTYGWAMQVQTDHTEVPVPETRYPVSTVSGSATFTILNTTTIISIIFYTDGHCSGGEVLDVNLVAGTPPAFCEHGTRLQLPGTLVYNLTPALIDLWLTALGAPYLAILFTPFYYSIIRADTLCGANPPSMPTIDLSTLTAGVATWWQILQVVAWSQLCECTPGSPAPTPFPPPTLEAPTGWPSAPTFTCDGTDLCASLVAIQTAIAQLTVQVGSQAQLVTLLQRYLLPMAVIRGATHSGVTGSGTIAISRLIGIEVTVTDATAPHKILFGNPAYVWQLGWMSLQTGDGLVDEKRLSRGHQTWTSRLFPFATTLGYAFSPDVTVDITELQAEP